LENYKHYTVLKETLKIISKSHEKWFSNHGFHASDPILNIKENVLIHNIFAKDIALSFFTEYDQYYKTDYFFGCSFDVYKKTYNKRLEDFKNEFIDTDEISFITDELDEGIYNYKFKEFNSDYFDNEIISRHEKLKKQINNSLIKRFEYLCQRAKENSFDLVYNKRIETYSLERIKQLLEVKKQDSLTDYSNSKLTEKIIALNEAGILDFLRNKEPFNLSVNSLAEFLSLCLGEKTTSIQSYINAIINKSDQSKSPYNTPKTVEKVKQKLIQIGLKIE
jgi:hypothetical protein